MSIKLAVFDIAGTILADDDAVADAFCRAFAIKGVKISPEQINPLMGYKKTLAIKIALESTNVVWTNELVEEIHDEFENEMLDYYEYSPEVRSMPGAEEVLAELKEKGIRIALNTGFSRPIADAIVERLQWKEKGLIDDYIASDEVEMGRPEPLMIKMLMARAGIDDPKQVIKIGDTEVDINEGKKAGCCLVVAVTTGAFTRQELLFHHPDYIIDHLSELPALIHAHVRDHRGIATESW